MAIWPVRVICLGLTLCLWLGAAPPGLGETLSDRLARYPNWHDRPSTQPASGDLTYPDWLAGDWQLQTTLVDLTAPLAPDITTPGFERNRNYLNQPIAFPVRFIMANLRPTPTIGPGRSRTGIVADRAFNGLSIAKAYLGEDRVQSVKVDPTNPNRQLTQLNGNRQLESTIADRAVEQPNADRFITTEVFQQIFRGTDQPYLNQVETTTDYHRTDYHRQVTATKLIGEPQPAGIVADQVTAIYLAPSDPNYFKASGTPVALYRYKLEFFASQK